MAVLFSDSFNRADSATVDATNWQENGATDWEILSNALRYAAVGAAPGSCLTTSSAHAATADVKVTVTQVDSAGDGGPAARWTAGTFGATSDGYVVDVYTGRCEMYRHDGSSTGVLLGSGVAVTQVANGVIAIEVSGTGATVTVKSFYQGTQRESVGDTSANRITTAERTGVYAWTGGVNGDYDDFQVEDLVAGTKARPIFKRRTRFFTRSW